MKFNTVFALLFVPMNALVVQCGSYHIDARRYATSVNGDPVHTVSPRFTAAPGDYDNVIITLRRQRITDEPFSFVLTTKVGQVSMDYVTDEDPPCVLNRESCRGSLREFSRE